MDISLISPQGLFENIDLHWPGLGFGPGSGSGTGPVAGELLEAISSAARVLPAGAHLTLRLKCPAPWRESQGLVNIPALIGALTGRCGFEQLAGPGVVAAEGGSAGKQLAGPRLEMTLRRRNHRPRWRLSGLAETDFGPFAALFASAFQHPISIDLWRWKYAAGRGVAVCAWRGADLIAHYGGMLRQVLAFGLPVTALQVCDAMVAVKERGVLSKSGAMFQVTATFLELYQGLARVPLAFGFPNQRAMALGELTGLYAEVGRLAEVSWPARQAPPQLGSRLVDFQPDQIAHRRAVEDLWTARKISGNRWSACVIGPTCAIATSNIRNIAIAWFWPWNV